MLKLVEAMANMKEQEALAIFEELLGRAPWLPWLLAKKQRGGSRWTRSRSWTGR